MGPTLQHDAVVVADAHRLGPLRGLIGLVAAAHAEATPREPEGPCAHVCRCQFARVHARVKARRLHGVCVHSELGCCAGAPQHAAVAAAHACWRCAGRFHAAVSQLHQKQS